MTNLECCTILQTKHDKHGGLHCFTKNNKHGVLHDKHGVLHYFTNKTLQTWSVALFYKQNMTNLECCTILQTKQTKHDKLGVLHYFTNKT